MTNLPRPVAGGVQKAPRHEVAGSLALAVLRALWGFDSGAGLEGGCNTERMRPAHRNGEVATLTEGLAHDVSILLGIGRHLGSQPRANTSITIMRPPQRAQGQGSTRGVSVAISGGSCG